MNGRANRPNLRQCVNYLGPGRQVNPQPGPIVLESKSEEVPDLKDRSVEHTAFTTILLDLRWYREPSEFVRQRHEVEVDDMQPPVGASARFRR